MKKQIISASLLIVGFLIGATALSAVAGTWTAPSVPNGTETLPCTPPKCNVDAPVNVGTFAQIKTGLLGLSDLMVGKLQVFTEEGTTTATAGKVLTALDNDGTVGWRDSGGSDGGPLNAFLMYNGSTGTTGSNVNAVLNLIGNISDCEAILVWGSSGDFMNIPVNLFKNLTRPDNDTWAGSSPNGWRVQTFSGDDTGIIEVVYQSDTAIKYMTYRGASIEKIFCLTKLETYSGVTYPNKITAFTNSTSYPYNTLSSSGTNITSAIETSKNIGAAISNQLTLFSGRNYRLTYTLNLISGRAPNIIFASEAHGSGTGRGLQTLAKVGTNSVIFKPTVSQGYLSFQIPFNYTSNFSVSDVQLVQVEE